MHMQPVLQDLQEALGKKARIHNFWIQQHPEVARQHSIMVMPTQVIFNPNGEEVFRHMGYFPPEEFHADTSKARPLLMESLLQSLAAERERAPPARDAAARFPRRCGLVGEPVRPGGGAARDRDGGWRRDDAGSGSHPLPRLRRRPGAVLHRARGDRGPNRFAHRRRRLGVESGTGRRPHRHGAPPHRPRPAAPCLSSTGSVSAVRGSPGRSVLGRLPARLSSPCATPILVVVLSLVAFERKVLWGTTLLAAYSLGHVVLLLAAGTAIGLRRRVPGQPRSGVGESGCTRCLA